MCRKKSPKIKINVFLCLTQIQDVLVHTYVQWLDIYDNHKPIYFYMAYQVLWMTKTTNNYGFRLLSPKV